MTKVVIEFYVDENNMDLEVSSAIPTKEEVLRVINQSFPCAEETKVRYIEYNYD